MFYLNNTDDGLWYEVSLVGAGDDMTIVWGGPGLEKAPEYVPDFDDPIISPAEYIRILGLEELDVPLYAWLAAAMSVSDAVEGWCATSWRVPDYDPLIPASDPEWRVASLRPVPQGLKTVVAMIIRDMLGRLGQSSAGGAVRMTPGMKKETLRNYSYELADMATMFDTTGIVEWYGGLLRPYRQLYVGA